MQQLIETDLPDATIVETNAYYAGGRYTTEDHRQISYMHELGMGNWRYELIDVDNDDAVIQPADAVADVVPFEA